MGRSQTGVRRLLTAHRAQYRRCLLHGPPRRAIPLCKTFFITYMCCICAIMSQKKTYMCYWWVIFCNCEDNFRDVPPEVIAPLLLGIDID
uniref:Uncharacterized protein n=1 Tax=Aegilops tauschii subsp. strangulata TaxID=200361 RepID=A0A453GFU3_AEGTS